MYAYLQNPLQNRINYNSQLLNPEELSCQTWALDCIIPRQSRQATNWQLTSEVFQTAKLKTGSFRDSAGNANVFSNTHDAVNDFRLAFAGESGQRNNLRGPGYFDIDMGLAKSWRITESNALQFRWDTFNIFNSVRFDVASATISNMSLANASNFGNYIKTLTSPRVMQFSLRYSF